MTLGALVDWRKETHVINYAVIVYLVFISLITGEQLVAAQKGFQAKSYALNTVSTRDTQLKKYLEFVAEFSTTHSPSPCPPEQVELYATWLARTLCYSSILNYLSGLNNFLKKNRCPTINYDDYVLASTQQVVSGGKRGTRLDRRCLCCLLCC